jgi:hypothetical protein
MLKTIQLFALSIVFAFFFIERTALSAEPSISPVTEKTILHFQKLNREIDYGRSVSEMLLRCSYLQDAWLAYLHEAENQEEFLQGMALIDQEIKPFRDNLKYAATIVNFFHPGKPRTLFPQMIETNNGLEFLNTFKTGMDLCEEQRKRIFDEEWQQYQLESIQEPFILNVETVSELVSGKLYNFVLLPDGTIRIAAEKPQGKEYLADGETIAGDMAYPNHTILAGAPHQSLLTAGALTLYRFEEKQLMFISNKSGHFVPTFDSLDAMRERLAVLGVDPHTVISVPTVNLSEAVIGVYNAQIPIYLVHDDLKMLFDRAYEKWMRVIEKIDLELLVELSQGNFSNLNRQVIDKLNQLREESTYMRSAYRLFTQDHSCPTYFHKFVKHFGKLKDGIKHNVDEVIISEAKWLCHFLQNNAKVVFNNPVSFDVEEGFYKFIHEEIQSIKYLIEKEILQIKELHDVKKGVRELGFLFQCLAEDVIDYGQYFFVYEAMSNKLFRFNQQLAVIHDEEIGKIMHGKIKKDEIFLQMPPDLKTNITTYMDKLGSIPDNLKIEIKAKTVSKLINEAKEWYFYHYIISKNPDELENLTTSDPLPRNLFNRIVETEHFMPCEEDFIAIEHLKKVQRKAEIARNALIFLDASHQSPIEWNLYIESLRKIIKTVETQKADNLKEEAYVMLKFISMRGIPTTALEKYQCTDQESFNEIFAKQLFFIKALKASSISYEFAKEIKERVQSLADLMHLFLLIGQRNQQLPTICYEKTFQDCEMILEEISHQMKYLDLKGNLRIPAKINHLSDKLMKRWKVE